MEQFYSKLQLSNRTRNTLNRVGKFPVFGRLFVLCILYLMNEIKVVKDVGTLMFKEDTGEQDKHQFVNNTKID